MLKLQTVNKLSVAQEIRDQTLKETQEVSNALIAAEQRIGELLLAIPSMAGTRTDLETSSPEGEKVKTKSETASELGYTRKNVDEYQQMAKHPEVVQRVIDDALANGEVVTKSQVLKEIKAEREKLKAEADIRLAEKDRRIKALETDGKEREDYISQREEYIHELENREVEVKVIEKKVEVIPEDYEETKRKAEMADGYKKDFHSMQKAYEEMAEKWKSAEKERESLISEMKRPENEKAEKIKKSALFFCAGISNFIEKYGGYVWLSEQINEMEPSERKGYLAAINAVESWVFQMKNNIERENLNEKH